MNREPPHNLEAERAVIGSALVYGEMAVAESEALRADEFFYPQHRDVWVPISELGAKAKPVDPISVQVELEAAGTSARFQPSWLQWAGECAGQACVPQQVGHFARMVREASASRKLIELCTHTIALAHRAQSWDEQITSIREGISALETLNMPSGTVHASQIIRATCGEIERIQAGEQVPRVYLGISTVDRLLDGLEPGDLVIVAARPGIGKSAFVGNVAAHCGFHNVPSLFMSVEMMANKLGRRWLSAEAKIDSHKFKRGDIDVEEWKKITAAASRFDGSLLWVNDRASTLGQVAGELRRWHGRYVAPRFAKSGKTDDRRALAVVDYAQRIQIGREKGDTREQEVSKVPTGLKNLAKQLGIPVLLVAQLSRAYEQRGGDPQLSDLRETGAFEQEADIVIFLVHDKDGGHRAIVAKNREGGTGNAACLWEPEVTSWKALADDVAELAPHWSDNER